MAKFWKKVEKNNDWEEFLVPADDTEIMLDNDEISPWEAAFLHGYTEDIWF